MPPHFCLTPNTQNPLHARHVTYRNITAIRSALVFAHIYHHSINKHQQTKSSKNIISVAFVNLLCFSFKLLYIYLFKNNLCPSCTCAQTLLYHFNIPLSSTRSIKSVSSCLVLIVSFTVVLKVSFTT